MNQKIDEATTLEEVRLELTMLRERVKTCSTMNKAQKLGLFRAMKEMCGALGLIREATSPADLVREVTDMCKEVDRLRGGYIFYKKRCEALQRWQSSMRDPERTVVCDILANGFTLDIKTSGDRYGDMRPNFEQ